MKSYSYLLPVLIVTTVGCGSNTARNTPETQTGAPSTTTSEDDTTLLLGDEQLAGDNVGDTVDDAISDMLEGNESKDGANSGFSLLDTDKVARVNRFRECKVDDTGEKAVVTIKRSVERERTVGKFNRSGSSVLKQLMERTRTWSKDGAAVACAADGKHAAIDRADLQGITLVAKFTREHLQSSTFQNSKKGISVSQSRKTSASGERTIKWTSVKTEGANLVLTKEVRTTSNRSFESLNKKGETKSFSTSVATDANAPLVVTTVREKSTDKLVSNTIVSGKKIATLKSGARFETVFTNVKYLPGDACYASSGKIEGSIFAKDATTASATYVVDFSPETKTVVLTKADGTVIESDYVADGCDVDGQELEEASGVPVEKTSANDVSLKI